MSKMQSVIMSNRTLTNWFMSSMPAGFWERIGQRQALQVFRTAAERVPAYKDFLKKHKIDPSKIKTMEDFKKLPQTSRKDYISQYPLNELCLDGSLTSGYTIERSSGSSGEPIYFPRLPEEDKLFPKYIEYAFLQYYHIDTTPTLVVVSLYLGIGTAGEKMAQALRTIAANPKYKGHISVITPGANLDDTIEITQKLGRHFDQLVIVGYPLFISSLVEQGEARLIDWKKLNVRFGLGGEGYSEQWREYIAEKIGLHPNDLLGVSGGYGAADLGMTIGREYPLTVLTRKLALRKEALAQKLFGGSTVPSLLQFNPGNCWVEEQDGELLFTVLSGIPQVRYNIKDRGGVIPFGKVLPVLASYGYDAGEMLAERGYSGKNIWKLPMFYVFGRSDGTISVGGAIVYPEHLETVLYGKEAELINSFKICSVLKGTMNEFQILVELKNGVTLKSKEEAQALQSKYYVSFLNALLKHNHEFRDFYQMGMKVAPVVKVYQYAEGPFAPDGKHKRTYIYENA